MLVCVPVCVWIRTCACKCVQFSFNFSSSVEGQIDTYEVWQKNFVKYTKTVWSVAVLYWLATHLFYTYHSIQDQSQYKPPLIKTKKIWSHPPAPKLDCLHLFTSLFFHYCLMNKELSFRLRIMFRKKTSTHSIYTPTHPHAHILTCIQDTTRLRGVFAV